MSAPTITRKQLVEAAERSMAPVEDVDPALREEVLDVARTASRVAKTWWVEPDGCGCLIGTLRRQAGRDEVPLGSDLRSGETAIGIRFPEALEYVLGKDGEGIGFHDVIEVIDP